MKTYLIDGNNLIGKIPEIMKLQKQDKQASRERLAFMIDRVFLNRKEKVFLHFDGFENIKIKLSKVKIRYSDSGSADEKIKKQISDSKNRKSLVVVTSDNNLSEFARVCSCEVIKSEDFVKNMMQSRSDDDEKRIIDEMKNDIAEFKKLFDAE